MTETLPATITSDMMVGLEDMDTSDLVMPRLRLLHDEAVFQDNLSNEKFEELEVVILGLVKGRVLWDTEVEEDAQPMCRSLDHNIGRPNLATFPFKAAGFDKSELDANDPQVACSACPLKDWGSHPTRDVPWCNEQYVLPVLMPVGGGWTPAITTFQRTAIKPVKSYLSSFARAKTPTFVTTTKMSLLAQKKGSVRYAVPQLVKGEPTNQDDYQEFASQYIAIRDFLQTPRSFSETETVAKAPTAATATAPVAESAEAVEDDDDLPF